MPVALRKEYIVDKPTQFRIQQHGKGLSSGRFTVLQPTENDNGKESCAAKGQQEPPTLMFIDGKYMSMDEKRHFCDASGLPLFNVYHRKMGVTWYIELPGGGAGSPIGRIMPRRSTLKDKLDVEIKNAAVNGEEVRLRVQGQDIWKQRTDVFLGDKVVMTAKRTEKMAVYLPGKKMEWDIDIAAGMDISLASVIVIVMAANMYDSSMQSSSS